MTERMKKTCLCLFKVYRKLQFTHRVIADYETRDDDRFGAATAAEEHFEAISELEDIIEILLAPKEDA